MARRRKDRRLLIIGGAEDRLDKATVLRRFVRLAGGAEASLAIIPTASSIPDEVGQAYTEVFARLGSGSSCIVDPGSRQEAHDPELVARIDASTGVFMSGGSQLRLSQFLPGTPLGEAIHRAHDRGAVVGGTSAGASIMSEFMISMGEEGYTPRQRASHLTLGLGLITGVVIDQHFGQRSRYGRLMAVVAGSPALLGIGIDEDTAIEVRGESTFRVHGSGVVHVIDGSQVTSDFPDARQGAPMLVSGAVCHSLPSGASFDLQTRRLSEFVEKHADLDIRSRSARD